MEITLEKHRTLTIRGKLIATLEWCEECGLRCEKLVPEEAARRIGASAREIYRRVESREVHYTERNDGSVLICARSVLSVEGPVKETGLRRRSNDDKE